MFLSPYIRDEELPSRAPDIPQQTPFWEIHKMDNTQFESLDQMAEATAANPPQRDEGRGPP
jgi:hypothetical protein